MYHYGNRFRQLHSVTRQRLTEALTEMELTSAQGSIMGYLAHCSQMPTPKDVEKVLGLSHATVAGLLARMEKKGFIRLETDPDDRRCRRIRTLPKGHACNDAMHRTIEAVEEQVVKDFTPEERKQFADFLLRAVLNMGLSPCQVPEPNEQEESNP